MRIALLFNDKTEVLAEKLRSLRNGLDISCFQSIPAMLDMSYKRNYAFDRVVLNVARMQTQSEVNDLKNWLDENRGTELIMVGRPQDADKIKSFMQDYVSPSVGGIITERPNVGQLSDAILMSVQKVCETYGTASFRDIVSEDSGVEALVKDEVPVKEEPVVQPEPQPQQQVQPQVQQGQEKGGKRSFIKSLFGKGDNQKNQPNQQQTQAPVQQQQAPVQQPVQQQRQPQKPQPAPRRKPVRQEPAQSVEQPVQQEPEQEYNFVPQNDENTSNDDMYQFQPQEEPETWQEPEQEEPAEEVVEDSFTSGSQVDFEPDPVEEEPVAEVRQNRNQNVNQGYSSSHATGNAGSASSEPNFESARRRRPSYQRQPEKVEEVDVVNLGNMNLADVESSYRQQNEQPKVVEKIVEKEVIVNRGSNVVKGILGGALHRVIVVTGDRGTGLTLTALSIAQAFTKKVPVLLFDCDVDRHGLLSYINYGEFCQYEDSRLSGIKLCKSAGVFSQCAVPYENNFDLLTTNYGVSVSNDEISVASSVVCEMVHQYGLVVVDCPYDKVGCISDLLYMGSVIHCVEASKRGFMNMFCVNDAMKISPRDKRVMFDRGTIFLTKVSKDLDLKKLNKYLHEMYEPEGVDYLSPQQIPFNGKPTEDILERVLSKV